MPFVLDDIPTKGFVPDGGFLPDKDLGFFGKIAESLRRGQEQALSDVAYYDALVHQRGDVRQAIHRRKALRAREIAAPIDGNAIADMFYGGSRVASQMFQSMQAGGKGGIIAGGIGAGIGAVVGAIIPTIGDEVITVGAGATVGLKAASKFGIASGAALFSYKQGAGAMLGNMMDMGHDPKKAMLVSQIAAIPYAMLELGQIKAATPGLRKGLNKVLNSSVRKIMAETGKKYGKTLTSETLQELGQETTQIIAEDVSAYLSGHGIQLDRSALTERSRRLLDTAIESAKSFALIPAPGAAIDIATQIGPGTFKAPTDTPTKIIQEVEEGSADWTEEEFRSMFLDPEIDVEIEEKLFAQHLIDRGVSPSEAMSTMKSLKNTYAETISHKEDIDEQVSEITGNMRKEHKKLFKRRPVGSRKGQWKEWASETADKLTYYHLGMIRIGRMLESLDGEQNGPLTRYVWHPMRVGVAKSAIGRSMRMQGLLDAVQDMGLDIDDLYKQRVQLTDNLTLTLNDMLEVYLATKDADKLKNLRAYTGNAFTTKHIDAVLKAVDERPQLKLLGDWLLDSYSSDAGIITDLHYKTTGKLLKVHEGYSPIKRARKGWTRFLNIDEEFEDLLHSHILGEGVFKRKAVQKGFTKKRTKAKGPLNLDALGNYVAHARAVEHYKAMVIPVFNANRLLGNKTFRRVTDKLTRNAGNKILQKWLQDVASERTSLENTLLNHMLGIFRRNAVTASLGLNIVSAMKQPVSISLALAENPKMIPHFFRAAAEWSSSPKEMKKFVHDRSTVVKHRNMERELREMAQRRNVRKQIKGKRNFHEKSMFLIRKMDQGTVQLVWKAAYDMALNERGDEQLAIRYADGVVERTQPMADIMDLPHFYRGSELSKMLTLFTNQINQNYNYWAHDILGVGGKGIIQQELAYRIMMATIIPAAILGLITRGFTPGEPGEWIKDQASFLVAPYFVIGRFISALMQGYDPSAILPFKFLEEYYDASRAKTAKAKTHHLIGGTAQLIGIPWSQPKRTVKGIIALQADADDPRQVIWSEAALREED